MVDEQGGKRHVLQYVEITHNADHEGIMFVVNVIRDVFTSPTQRSNTVTLFLVLLVKLTEHTTASSHHQKIIFIVSRKRQHQHSNCFQCKLCVHHDYINRLVGYQYGL